MSWGFRVTVRGFEILEEIKGAWSDADFAQLLERMDYGETEGMSQDELLEMCVLSLQDLEINEAAEMLLEIRLGELLRKGQIQTIALDMASDKLWEEHANMPLHEQLFHVGSLLHKVFPGRVPEPDAVDVSLAIEGINAESKSYLKGPIHESFLVRLMADGMSQRAKLKRLFADSLSGESFPEATSIVWISKVEATPEDTAQVQIIGAGHWLDALRETASYESAARPDTAR